MKSMYVNEKALFRLHLGAVIALFVAAVVAFLLGVWTGDGRWTTTGWILTPTAILASFTLAVWS